MLPTKQAKCEKLSVAHRKVSFKRSAQRGSRIKGQNMNIEQLNAWGAYYAAKDASEAKHGFVASWVNQDKHPWNVSEKAEFEKAQSEKVGA